MTYLMLCLRLSEIPRSIHRGDDEAQCGAVYLLNISRKQISSPVCKEFTFAWTDPTPPTYLSTNVDFTGEPALQALVNSGRIGASTIVEKQVSLDTERFGIVGAVPPTIKSISSPGNVIINDVLTSVQSEVDSLIAQGVNKIILVSHLQNIQEELNLIPQLHCVDTRRRHRHHSWWADCSQCSHN